MKKLIRFEIQKVTRSGYVKLLVIGYLVFTMLFFLFNFIHTNKILERELLKNENLLRNNLVYEEEAKQLLDSGNISEEEASMLEDELLYYEEEIEAIQKVITAFKQNNWSQVLDVQIEFEEILVQQYKLFNDANFSTGNRSLFSFETNLEQNKQIRDKNIKPVLPVDMSTTIYDKFVTEKDAETVKRYSKKYDSSALYVLYKLFNVFFSVIGVGFFLFLFGDILTKEGIGKNGPAHLLFIQPVNRFSIVTTKYLALIIVTSVMLVGAVIVTFLLGTIFDRAGDSNYPILVYEEDMKFSFMNLSHYLLKSFILFFFILVFSYTILILFSLIFKNTLAAIGTTVLVLFGGMLFTTESFFTVFTAYSPFSYLSVEKIINHELAASLNNFNVTFNHGLITISVYTIALWGIIYYFYNHRVKRLN